jgi:hypothetical protein
MVSFQFSLKEPGKQAMGGIGGAIGIKGKTDGAARPIVLGLRAPGNLQHPDRIIKPSWCTIERSN